MLIFVAAGQQGSRMKHLRKQGNTSNSGFGLNRKGVAAMLNRSIRSPKDNSKPFIFNAASFN
jgi:hypothetical protein